MKKKIGNGNVIINKDDFIQRQTPDTCQEFASENCYVDIDTVNILAVRIKLKFNKVTHARPEINLATYFFGNHESYGEHSIVRYLDPSTCEIIFKRSPSKPVFIHRIAFGCNHADLDMDVEVFDITQEETEEDSPFIKIDKI